MHQWLTEFIGHRLTKSRYFPGRAVRSILSTTGACHMTGGWGLGFKLKEYKSSKYITKFYYTLISIVKKLLNLVFLVYGNRTMYGVGKFY